MMKYKYTYNEQSVDVREYEVESEVMLTEGEVQEIALGCTLKEGHTYQGGEKGKRYQGKFLGTEFGDDAQPEYGGDEYKCEK
tara:strand:+ start:310 stop:555 length:246 start_codon:yes stop_codon:yes gene_type:complete